RNGDLRTREYLTEHEVERLIDVAKRNRHGRRTLRWFLWPTGMACERPNWSTCGGIRSTSKPRPYTSAESRRALLACIPSSAMNCGRCGGYSASRTSHRSCSPRNAARRSTRPVSLAWSNAQPFHPHMLRQRLRLCAGQQRTRYASAASPPRAQKHPAHGALHRAVVDPVQKLLARITAGVLQKKRQRNRSQRHSRNDHHSAGDADEVAKKPRDRWRNCGRADRYRVEHAEQMRAPIRCSIVRHRTVDHGGDAIEYKTDKRKNY